jgi:hypothetical protein
MIGRCNDLMGLASRGDQQPVFTITATFFYPERKWAWPSCERGLAVARGITLTLAGQRTSE